MPSVRDHRKGEKNHERGRLSEKSSASFHGREGGAAEEMFRRPRTAPDMLARSRKEVTAAWRRPLKLTKLLLNVTVQRSLRLVQVVLQPEATVEDLISAALRQYSKEGRRPLLSSDSSNFNLHYSQFSLESLNREEKISELWSRNFFLCPNTRMGNPSCSKETDEDSKKGLTWLKFMGIFAVNEP